MSWLRKICKGSSHKISKENHQAKSNDNDDGVRNEPTNSLLLSGYESEDLDLAIALSLSEEELQTPIFNGTNSNTDEDEQLARALQESLNTKSSPENRESPRICAVCENGIAPGDFLSLMDVIWHPGCLRCYACYKKIIGYDFDIYEDHPYHLSCYRNLYHPKCDVCNELVPTNYCVLPIWMQRICPSHLHDGTQSCYSCHRKKPRGASYSRLDDRAMLCLECLESSITNTNKSQPIYQDIQNFYKSLNMDFVQEIPLYLVERGTLLSKVTMSQGFPLPDDFIGVCVTKGEAIQTKNKRLEISIRILKGLPRIMTGSNLAHEMMHAWLRLNGYGMLNPHVEEGICVVMSYIWLDFQLMSSSSSNVASSSSSSSSAPYRKCQISQYERKLAGYYKFAWETIEIPIYSDGFKEGYAAVLKYGLKSVLDHIKLRRSFPS